MSSAQHTRQTRKIKQLKSFAIDGIKTGGKEEKKVEKFPSSAHNSVREETKKRP